MTQGLFNIHNVEDVSVYVYDQRNVLRACFYFSEKGTFLYTKHLVRIWLVCHQWCHLYTLLSTKSQWKKKWRLFVLFQSCFGHVLHSMSFTDLIIQRQLYYLNIHLFAFRIIATKCILCSPFSEPQITSQNNACESKSSAVATKKTTPNF
jgi:hypothetical protein